MSPTLTPAQARALLTTRELEIIAVGVEVGGVRKLVGDRLGISPETVRVHRQNAYRKLGVTTQIEALRVLGYLA